MRWLATVWLVLLWSTPCFPADPPANLTAGQQEFWHLAARIIGSVQNASHADCEAFFEHRYLISRTIAIARRYGIRHDADVADILQEVRVRLVTLRPSQVTNIIGLLDRIAQQRTLNFIRKEKRRESQRIVEEFDQELAYSVAQERAEARTAELQAYVEEKEILLVALRTLPPNYQHVLTPQIVGERRSYETLAAEMGLTPNAVKSLMTRARLALKIAYDKQVSGCEHALRLP